MKLLPTRFLRIAAMGLALTPALWAQTQSPEPAFMQHVPAIGPVVPYAPPTSVQDQLPNGLTVVVVQDHRFPLIHAVLALRAGSTRLSPQQAGLASAEADLLTSGTPHRTALEISQAADAMGGSIDASAGSDFLTIGASALSSHAQDMFALLAEVVLHPTFPANEVQLEKANLLQGLIASRANPGFLANVRFNQALFGSNPYAITAPTEASIAALDRSQLIAFHQKYFLPNNQAEIVVVGDIDPAHARNLVEQSFGAWQLGNVSVPKLPPVPPPSTRQIELIDRPHSAQSTILLGNLGLTRLAPNYFPFVVVNEVLGGSFNSRLMSEVREQKGYAYGISSANQPYRELGSWIVSTQVRTAVTAPALQAVFSQLDQIRAAPPSPTEMTQAKNYLTGNFVLGLQTQGAVAAQFLTTGIYGLPRNRLATWVSDVEKVTAEQAQQAARANIHANREIVVVVGDVRQIEASLAKLVPGTPIPIYNEKDQQVGQYSPKAQSAAAATKPTGRHH